MIKWSDKKFSKQKSDGLRRLSIVGNEIFRCVSISYSTVVVSVFWRQILKQHLTQPDTANCQLPTANCQLPTAKCQQLTATCQLPTTKLSVIE
jgi:hypothetical protein